MALIKSQKAELEALHQKIDKLNRENEEKSAKLDELEIRLGLTKVTLADEEKTAKIASLEKKIKTFVAENIKLKTVNQKLQDGCINQRDALAAAKSKISDLKEKNEELLSDNRTLSEGTQNYDIFIETNMTLAHYFDPEKVALIRNRKPSKMSNLQRKNQSRTRINAKPKCVSNLPRTHFLLTTM